MFKEMLKYLKLHPLERQRVLGDMIEVLKCIKQTNKGDIGKILTVNE